MLTQQKIDEFLRESNAIEGVYAEDALEAAREAFSYLLKQEKLTTDVILETHRLLMQPASAWDASAVAYRNGATGKFRKINVYIGRKEAPSPIAVPHLVKHWLLSIKPKSDPIGFHIAYEEIHPFVDGNGRTGRMFLNWMLLKQGKGFMIIKEAEKAAYYKWFQ